MLDPPLPLLLLSTGQAEAVFSNMAGDFMRPVVDVVDKLLTAGVNVTVYNGQLDLIVDTMGNFLLKRGRGHVGGLRPVTRILCFPSQVRSCG